MARCDPRTSLFVGSCLAATGVFGMKASLVALGLVPVWLLLARIPLSVLATRVGPLAGGFAILLLAAPFAPARTLDVAVRGLVISSAAAITAWAVPWTIAVGVLQHLHAPRVVVAFAALLARQMVSLRDEVRRVYRAMLVRGAFDRRAGAVRAAVLLLSLLAPTALARADHLADALALRGFDGRIPQPAPWRPRLAEAPHYVIGMVALAAAVWEKVPWIRSVCTSTM